MLMLSMHSEETCVRQALDAGARGYILKNADGFGTGHGDPPSAEEKKCSTPEVSRAPSLKGERDAGLTPRELEILQLIVDGKSNKEIADRSYLSANTVAVHRANMMERWESTRPPN